MSLFLKLKGKSAFQSPRSVAEAIARNLPPSEMIESLSVAGQGFVNIAISNTWIAKRIQQMLVNGIQTWAPKLQLKRVVVDFSSPNIAKELHVGHLRSTIIGDSIARMLEFSNVEVLRRNHVGDWGTQFGKLLAYLFEGFPNWEDDTQVPIRDLQNFYKEAQKKYEDDPVFAQQARMAVVKLQCGEARYRKAWEGICNISRLEYEKIYHCLDVNLEEKGESFYHSFIPGVLQMLREKGLVSEKDGALMVAIEGMSIAAVVTKSGGGYTYVSTDLAALWETLEISCASDSIHLF